MCILPFSEELVYGHQLCPADCWQCRSAVSRDSCCRTMYLRGVQSLRCESRFVFLPALPLAFASVACCSALRHVDLKGHMAS